MALDHLIGGNRFVFDEVVAGMHGGVGSHAAQPATHYRSCAAVEKM
jgi:hypothetical protein